MYKVKSHLAYIQSFTAIAELSELARIKCCTLESVVCTIKVIKYYKKTYIIILHYKYTCTLKLMRNNIIHTSSDSIIIYMY